MSHDREELERIECRLERIERLLRRLLCLEGEEAVERHAVHTLNLQAGEPVAIDMAKPPTQGVGVPGSDQGTVGHVATPTSETADMRSIRKLINEPPVRMLLLREARREVPEQVQYQRVMCEVVVLAACGARAYHDLAAGEPAAKLAKLVHRLAVFSGGF